MFGYSTEMFAIWLTFSYIMFSAVFPTSALSEVELKVKYGKEKRTWNSALQSCGSFGPEWNIPSVDDISLITISMNKKRWKSVWTRIKRMTFDTFYWEDGSMLHPDTVNERSSTEENAGPLCMAIQADIRKFEALSCYSVSTSAMCLVGNSDCSKNKNFCHHFGGICYVWPKESMSWYTSRNWCHKKGGHLMNKSNIEQYVPPYSLTKKKYYWIGLRKADWTLYNNAERPGKVISPGIWADNEPLEGKDCSVISEYKLKSEFCDSEQHFLCVARFQEDDFVDSTSAKQLEDATGLQTLSDSYTCSPSGTSSGCSNPPIMLIVVVVLFVLVMVVMLVVIIYPMYRLKRHKTDHENAEVNIDCESFIRQSPSNRPPALLPPDAHLPNVTNEDQQESSTGGLPDHLYSTPLTEEDIFKMVMTGVRKQLGETSRMGASKRKNMILRSAAKCVVEDYLEPVIDESGSGQIVLKQGKRQAIASTIHADPKTGTDPAGPSSECSFTKQELREVRTILSDLLNELFTSKKGAVTVTLSLRDSLDSSD